MNCRTFTGANFTGFLGERFFFRILGYDGRFVGHTLAGRVVKIFRRGLRTSVEIYVPELKRIFIYEAKQIYFRGYIAKGKETDFMGTSEEYCCGTCMRTLTTAGFVSTATASTAPISPIMTTPARIGREGNEKSYHNRF